MKKFFLNLLFVILIILVTLFYYHYFSNQEIYTRGFIVARGKDGTLISWRSFQEDDKNIKFQLYKNKQLLKTFFYQDPTNYLDSNYIEGEQYELIVIQHYKKQRIKPEVNFFNENNGISGAYFDVPLDIPKDVIMPDGEVATYSPNDVVSYDVDHDGIMELIVKWDPSNSKDNSIAGYTGNVFIDCYKISGKKMWRIDLGKNIRAGANYTQMLVYDYDQDGKAEMILRTSDGTVDNYGTIIGNPTADYRDDNGIITRGNEYITLFDGVSGKILDTVPYYPERGNINDWGDSIGNRSDRFLATTLYLDGKKPSAVLIRGYYTRIVAVSYQIKNKKLKRGWIFDTNDSQNREAMGNGNHQVMPADVDQDGKDEIMLGSLVIDDDGTILHNANLGHGDVLHIGDFDLKNKGLEIFMCHEIEPFGISLRDGKTGKILFRSTGSIDTGRCLIDNFIAHNKSSEMVGLQDTIVYDTNGNILGNWIENNPEWNDEKEKGINFLIYWDGELDRELLNDVQIKKYGDSLLFQGDSVKSINSTKRNPSLSADLFGDYREEVIFPTIDNQYLRIFTTTFYTPYKVNYLMENRQYKLQSILQNVGYNQPPHLDYYLK